MPPSSVTDEVRAGAHLQPVERRTLAQGAMHRLIEHIRGGALKPGDPLPSQHELARQLSISRPVLREAMQGLASMGIVEIRPGKGCFVREPVPRQTAEPWSTPEVFSHETALEVIEARMVVEVELAVLAAQRATEADLAEMEAILERLDLAVRRGQPTAQVTSDFHQALARAGHNSVLFQMTQVLTGPRLAQGLRVEQALPAVGMGEYESHRRLYDAVRSGNPDLARSEMRLHLELAHGWEDEIAVLRRAKSVAGREEPSGG